MSCCKQAMERRAAARQQAAALQSVRHRLARQVAATQRAQQAAAMFQRSMAVSRQIATLQARALLGAVNAMQVRHPRHHSALPATLVSTCVILLGCMSCLKIWPSRAVERTAMKCPDQLNWVLADVMIHQIAR